MLPSYFAYIFVNLRQKARPSLFSYIQFNTLVENLVLSAVAQ